MNVIVCIDDRGGMLFNNRRQSKDKKVIEDISSMTEDLWIHPFSKSLFAGAMVNCKVDEDFLAQAGKGEYCFVENVELSSYADKIEELIVYKWNRKYPYDFGLDLPCSEWKLKEQSEFAGISHEKITKEVYEGK